LLYSCTDIETLKPLSQSLNRIPDIETTRIQESTCIS
jgi:hypothetical protein